jgi:hypothetical protein
LFAVFGSKLGELADAVFVIDVLLPEPFTFTVRVTVAEAPFPMFPKLHVIVPTVPTAGTLHEAPPEFSEKKVAFAGTGSFNTTAVARYGPRFFTVTV